MGVFSRSWCTEKWSNATTSGNAQTSNLVEYVWRDGAGTCWRMWQWSKFLKFLNVSAPPFDKPPVDLPGAYHEGLNDPDDSFTRLLRSERRHHPLNAGLYSRLVFLSVCVGDVDAMRSGWCLNCMTWCGGYLECGWMTWMLCRWYLDAVDMMVMWMGWWMDAVWSAWRDVDAVYNVHEWRGWDIDIV